MNSPRLDCVRQWPTVAVRCYGNAGEGIPGKNSPKPQRVRQRPKRDALRGRTGERSSLRSRTQRTHTPLPIVTCQVINLLFVDLTAWILEILVGKSRFLRSVSVPVSHCGSGCSSVSNWTFHGKKSPMMLLVLKYSTQTDMSEYFSHFRLVSGTLKPVFLNAALNARFVPVIPADSEVASRQFPFES